MGRRAPDKLELGIACSIPTAFASAPSNRREGADCCALPLRSGEPGPQTRSPVKVTHPLLQRIPAPPPARNPSRAQIPTARTQPASTPRMRPTPRLTPRARVTRRQGRPTTARTRRLAGRIPPARRQATRRHTRTTSSQPGRPVGPLAGGGGPIPVLTGGSSVSAQEVPG